MVVTRERDLAPPRFVRSFVVRKTISSDDFLTTGRNCPFEGWKVTGRAISTIVGGMPRWSLQGDSRLTMATGH